jgi:hypothetical protein
VETLIDQDTKSRMITHQEVVGWMAHWAVRQHPYGRPEGLFDVTDLITAQARAWSEGIPTLSMWRVYAWREIEDWLRTVLKDHPILAAWNTPKSEHTMAIVATSIYWGLKPEHDFIDIDALLRNVARSTWHGVERN